MCTEVSEDHCMRGPTRDRLTTAGAQDTLAHSFFSCWLSLLSQRCCLMSALDANCVGSAQTSYVYICISYIHITYALQVLDHFALIHTHTHTHTPYMYMRCRSSTTLLQGKGLNVCVCVCVYVCVHYICQITGGRPILPPTICVQS